MHGKNTFEVGVILICLQVTNPGMFIYQRLCYLAKHAGARGDTDETLCCLYVIILS
jgi:hypothetical protein